MGFGVGGVASVWRLKVSPQYDDSDRCGNPSQPNGLPAYPMRRLQPTSRQSDISWIASLPAIVARLLP